MYSSTDVCVLAQLDHHFPPEISDITLEYVEPTMTPKQYQRACYYYLGNVALITMGMIMTVFLCISCYEIFQHPIAVAVQFIGMMYMIGWGRVEDTVEVYDLVGLRFPNGRVFLWTHSWWEKTYIGTYIKENAQILWKYRRRHGE